MIYKKQTSIVAVILLGLLFVPKALAMGTYFSSPSNGNPSYWNKCYQGPNGGGVTAQQFVGSAADEINKIAETHLEAVQKPLLESSLQAKNAQVKALSQMQSDLSVALNDAAMAINKTMADVERKNMKAEMEYLKTLSQQSLNEKHYGFYSEGNGLNRPTPPDETSPNENKNSAAYKNFKSMCKRGKMMSALSSDTKQFKENQSANNQSIKKTNEALEVSSASQKSRSKVQEHYSQYCDAYDIANGLCENDELQLCEEGDPSSGVCNADGEEYQLANADIDSVNFMKPTADIDNQQAKRMALVDGFTPTYTYNDEQLKGAKAYADTVVYSSLPEAPTADDMERVDKSRYISAYNSHLASLNLAYNSFISAIEARKPITEENDPVPMSDIDVMRYTLQDLEDSDNMAATMSGKEKGIDVALFSVMTINNKLELKKMKQKERIKALLAALVANEANSAENIEHLNDLR